MNLNKDKAKTVALPWKGTEVHSGGVCMDLAHGGMRKCTSVSSAVGLPERASAWTVVLLKMITTI